MKVKDLLSNMVSYLKGDSNNQVNELVKMLQSPGFWASMVATKWFTHKFDIDIKSVSPNIKQKNITIIFKYMQTTINYNMFFDYDDSKLCLIDINGKNKLTGVLYLDKKVIIQWILNNGLKERIIEIVNFKLKSNKSKVTPVKITDNPDNTWFQALGELSQIEALNNRSEFSKHYNSSYHQDHSHHDSDSSSSSSSSD